jgi:hypothetical protein
MLPRQCCREFRILKQRHGHLRRRRSEIQRGKEGGRQRETVSQREREGGSDRERKRQQREREGEREGER